MLALVFVLAGCGGSGGGLNAGTSRTPGQNGGSQLVANVSHAQIKVSGKTVTASVQVSIGGVAGKHIKLKWGLVDAEQNANSNNEKLLKAYVTTRAVVQHTESVQVPLPPHDYLIHFVLYAPNGSYLSAQDTEIFGGG